MGASKATLFLPRIVETASPVFDEVIAVQRAGGEGAEGIRTIFEDPQRGSKFEARSSKENLEPRTSNFQPPSGAIFGIEAALRHAQSRCFILAVDYPFVTSALLRELRDSGGVPVWNGYPQPLCAVWDFALLPLIERRIAAGQLDLRGLIAEANVEIIAEPALRARHRGEPLLNVNTPEELHEGERLHGR